MTIDLWNLTDEQNKLANKWIEENIPPWIYDIEAYDIAAICQGGCASGAYMPAVTYYKALQTMGEHGDDIIAYIENVYGEIPAHNQVSWSHIAVFYLSVAVESWAMHAESELRELLENE